MDGSRRIAAIERNVKLDRGYSQGKNETMLYKIIHVMIAATLFTNYTGFAAYYNPGVMERVARNRNMTPVDCMIASPHEEIGTWVYVISHYNGAIRMCKVYDVAHPQDRQTIINRGIIIELSWESAGVLCGISQNRIEPPKACTVTVYKRK